MPNWKNNCFLKQLLQFLSKKFWKILTYRNVPKTSFLTGISLKVLLARYLFFSDIVKTLLISYFMLLEYMCKVSQLLTIQDPRKSLLKKRLEKRLNTEFRMLRENWATFIITVNKCFLPLQWKLVVKLKAVSHFISQNLEAIDHPVSEIKNYDYCSMAFS